MERPLDGQLGELRSQVLVMGGHVERALAEVLRALRSRDGKGFQVVHETEKKVNEEQIRIDNTCVGILATQGPVAKDLRFIISVVKINTDLERMGDQSVNIAHTGKDYLNRPGLGQEVLIQKMGVIVSQMVKLSLDSFVRGDVELAKKILLMDDEVDGFKNQVFQELKNVMRNTADSVEAALDLILIARNLERLGDHATNIAEDVIFAYTGRDVRHGGAHG